MDLTPQPVVTTAPGTRTAEPSVDGVREKTRRPLTELSGAAESQEKSRSGDTGSQNQPIGAGTEATPSRATARYTEGSESISLVPLFTPTLSLAAMLRETRINPAQTL